MSAESTTPRTVHVALNERSYDIIIQPNIIAEAGRVLAATVHSRRCLVVTDRNVGPKYGPRLAKSLQMAGFDGSLAELPPGEAAKSLKVAEILYDRCLGAGLDRGSCLIALGGGVIGDLTGFVAATYYRGIVFVQVPTTLLAMVDAAIGGKTGVDLPTAKNAVGAFHQPRAVLIDPLTLATLPDRELKAGLAEVIKYGVLDDAELFAFIEQHSQQLLAKDTAALAHVIERCAAIKARIVSQDEREQGGGPRALLNLGHTFGHAIEAATGYQGYSHGEAVAIGMCMAVALSVELQWLAPADRDRVVALIAHVGLPTKLKPTDPDTNTLYAASLKDKKVAAGSLRFVVAEGIGKTKVVTDVPEAVVKKVWDSGRE
ncbi:MAG: 3-dehydroquinate synthase [Planctomycetota bacterium]|nr:3-dehydroquinate synthase [Planctomycetota bacterium]